MRDPEGVWISSALRAQENGELIMELKPVETENASPIANGEADIAIAGYLTEAAAAHTHMEASAHIGKIVLEVAP